MATKSSSAPTTASTDKAQNGKKLGLFAMTLLVVSAMFGGGIFNIPPTGFLGDQIRGFGVLHDGSIASPFNFIQAFDFEWFIFRDN